MKRIFCFIAVLALLAGCGATEAEPVVTTEAAPALSVEQTVLFESAYVTGSAQALTYGECGTPEMYGGIREVYLPMSIFLGDEPQTVEKYDSTIEFP